MANEVHKVKVKETGAVIYVYKLKSGEYCRYFGEDISIDKVERKEHEQTFTYDQLEFVS